MTVPIRNVLLNLKSYLAAQGWFSDVSIGEPKAPPAGFAAAVFMSTGDVRYLSRDTIVEGDTVTLRLYKSVLEEPAEDVEIAMAELVSTIRVAALGHFRLTEAQANLEVDQVTIRWDYLDIGGESFRGAGTDPP